MRILFAAISSLLVLWTGYWVVGERYLEARIAAVLAMDLPAGITLEQEGFDVAGFPSRFDLTLTQPNIRHLAGGWAWTGEFAQVFSMTWKPWHLIAALPDHQTITTPNGPVALTTARMMASLRVTPTTATALQEAVITVDKAALSAEFLPEITMEKLVIALREESGTGPSYRLGLTLANLSPLANDAVGAALTSARLDLVFDSTAALDRFAGETRPMLTGIDLRALQLDWGDVTLVGSGLILADGMGRAEGEIAMQIGGWKDLPARLSDFALVRRELVPALTRALEIIADEQGNPQILTLPLTFRGGRMTLGGLPLGPAPLLVQRQ